MIQVARFYEVQIQDGRGQPWRLLCVETNRRVAERAARDHVRVSWVGSTAQVVLRYSGEVLARWRATANTIVREEV